MADLATFIPTRANRRDRSRRSRPSARRRRSSARSPPRTSRPSCCASRTARAARSPSASSARAQELAAVRDRRLGRRRLLGLEQPDQLWIGHRDRPNEILIRNPALMGPAGQPPPRCRAGMSRGSPTRSGRCSAPSTPTSRRAPSDQPIYPTFADGHDEMLVNDAVAASARVGRWADVVREPACPTDGRRRGTAMRLGFLTAPFPETPLARWPTGPPPTGSRASRSPAGRARPGRLGATPARRTSTSPNLSEAEANEIVDEVTSKGLAISGSATTRTRCTPTPTCARPPSAT